MKKKKCLLKPKVKTQFFENDVARKQNSIDFLLEHNPNLFNHQCYWAIQDTQSNLRSSVKTSKLMTTCSNNNVNTNANEKKTICKLPLIKRMIKQLYIETTMAVT